MTAFANNLNGIASGTTVTTANSGGVSGTAFNAVTIPTGGSITAQASAAYEGATGLQFVYPTGSTAGYVFWSVTAAVGVRVAVSTWFKMASVPTSVDKILAFGGTSVSISTSSQISIVTPAAGTSASATVSTNSWVFLQLAVTSNASSTAGRIEARLYSSAGAQLFSYDSGATTNGGTTANPAVVFGRGTGGANTAGTHSFDLLAADNALAVGSFPGTAPAPTYDSGQFLPFL